MLSVVAVDVVVVVVVDGGGGDGGGGVTKTVSRLFVSCI